MAFYSILAGVLQGSAIGPLLYTLHSSDLPNASGITTAMFADDTAILAASRNYQEAVTDLQRSTNKMLLWAHRWKVKINNSESKFIVFTLRPYTYHLIKIGNQISTFTLN